MDKKIIIVIIAIVVVIASGVGIYSLDIFGPVDETKAIKLAKNKFFESNPDGAIEFGSESANLTKYNEKDMYKVTFNARTGESQTVSDVPIIVYNEKIYYVDPDDGSVHSP